MDPSRLKYNVRVRCVGGALHTVGLTTDEQFVCLDHPRGEQKDLATLEALGGEVKCLALRKAWGECLRATMRNGLKIPDLHSWGIPKALQLALREMAATIAQRKVRHPSCTATDLLGKRKSGLFIRAGADKGIRNRMVEFRATKTLANLLMRFYPGIRQALVHHQSYGPAGSSAGSGGDASYLQVTTNVYRWWSEVFVHGLQQVDGCVVLSISSTFADGSRVATVLTNDGYAARNAILRPGPDGKFSAVPQVIGRLCF